MLPGDIGTAAEKMLIENQGEALKSLVLVASHHGSASSSTASFIEMVMPQYVIFPTGYKNRFRFPHKKTVARYMNVNALLLNSTNTGAITFKFGDRLNMLEINSYREQQRLFWHDR